MKTKLLASFLLIILIPLMLVSWFSVKIWQDERVMASHREMVLIEQQLGEINQYIKSILKRQETVLLNEKIIDFDPWALRKKINQHPMIQQLLVINNKGDRVFPPKNMVLSQDEREFIHRTETFQQDLKDIQPIQTARESLAIASRGWRVWYWEDGLYLIYWWQDEKGMRYGVEINRIKLLSAACHNNPTLCAETISTPLHPFENVKPPHHYQQ